MIDITKLEVAEDTIVIEQWMNDVALSCITASDELGIFNCLSKNLYTNIELSEKLEICNKTLDAIIKVLIAYNYIEIFKDKLKLSLMAETYWVVKSPFYRGNEFIKRKDNLMHKRIVKSAKEGWAPISEFKEPITDMWIKGEISSGMASFFTSMMHSFIFGVSVNIVRSGIFDNFQTIADIGGGSGAFDIALLTHFPTKKAILVDLPQVIKEAKKYTDKFDVKNKIEFFKCNFFKDEFPQNVDAFYFSNILHDWNIKNCELILKKTYKNLKSTQKIFINEILLNEDKLSPKVAVVFNLSMYINHKAQQFSFNEIKDLLIKIGFKNIKIIFKTGYYSVIEAEK